jgi:hypothetical protein
VKTAGKPEGQEAIAPDAKYMDFVHWFAVFFQPTEENSNESRSYDVFGWISFLYTSDPANKKGLPKREALDTELRGITSCAQQWQFQPP